MCNKNYISKSYPIAVSDGAAMTLRAIVLFDVVMCGDLAGAARRGARWLCRLASLRRRHGERRALCHTAGDRAVRGRPRGGCRGLTGWAGPRMARPDPIVRRRSRRSARPRPRRRLRRALPRTRLTGAPARPRPPARPQPPAGSGRTGPARRSRDCAGRGRSLP